MFDDDNPAPEETRAERHLRLLQELAEIGMDIARAVRAEAVGAAEGVEPVAPPRFGRADPALVYSRIAKAVRQTLALEAHFAAGRAAALDFETRRRANEAQLILEHRQQDIREFVARAVEADAAVHETPEKEVERLLDDLDERLDSGDYDDTLADGPIAELVARICHDLGIVPDWRVWDDQDWGVEVLRNGLPEDIGAERWTGVYRLKDPAPAGEPATPAERSG